MLLAMLNDALRSFIHVFARLKEPVIQLREYFKITPVGIAQTGTLIRTFYTCPIFGIAWSPDGSRIVTGGYNKIGQVWSAK